MYRLLVNSFLPSFTHTDLNEEENYGEDYVDPDWPCTVSTVSYFLECWIKKFSCSSILKKNLSNFSLTVSDPTHYDNLSPDSNNYLYHNHANLAKQLISDVSDANCILIVVPIYNNKIPSSLKSYLESLYYSGFNLQDNKKVNQKNAVIIYAQFPSFIDEFESYVTFEAFQIFNRLGFKEIVEIKIQELHNTPEDYQAKIQAIYSIIDTYINQLSNQAIYSSLNTNNNLKLTNKLGKIADVNRLLYFGHKMENTTVLSSCSIFFPTLAELDKSDISFIKKLINTAYDEAEAGLWKVKGHRTDEDSLIQLIKKGELLLAMTDKQVIGCMYVKQIDKETAELGMLVTDPDFRKQGIGRKLIQTGEEWAIQRNCTAMNLMLLIPRNTTHPHKEFLLNWYTKIGYHEISQCPFESLEPHKQDLLAEPCNFIKFSKVLVNLELKKSPYKEHRM